MKIIELSGDVGWEITAKSLKNKLPKDNSDVRLKIDSYGGSVFEGVRLYNVIKDYMESPVVSRLYRLLLPPGLVGMWDFESNH